MTIIVEDRELTREIVDGHDRVDADIGVLMLEKGSQEGKNTQAGKDFYIWSVVNCEEA